MLDIVLFLFQYGPCPRDHHRIGDAVPTERSGDRKTVSADDGVLALLHAHSDGDRKPYDCYWRAATDVGRDYPSDLIASVCRRNEMLAEWHRIARSLGTEATIELMSAIHRLLLDKLDSPLPSHGGL